MAWTTPRTWVTGETVTASIMNVHVRDNLQALFDWFNNAWVSYTPTLTQSGAVTKTVTYAKYVQAGKFSVTNINLSVTGSGTGSNAIVIGTAVTAASSGSIPVGSGWIYDASASQNYKGIAYLATTTTLQLIGSGNGSLGAVEFTAALASSDSVNVHAAYEAA